MVDFEDVIDESGAEQAPPEPEQEQSEESTPEPEQKSAPAAPEVPFHEHPRFKELVEQKNQYQAQLKALQDRLDRQEHQSRQQPSAPKPTDKFVERLQGIDKDLADRIAKYDEGQETVSQLKARLADYEAATTRSQAETAINNLYSEHKVDPSIQKMYTAAIKDIANANPQMKLSDLSSVFKEVHENFTKFTETLRRSDRKSYVVDKKADAKAPTSQPKGEAAKPAKTKVSVDREEALASIAKMSIGKYRAGSDL